MITTTTISRRKLLEKLRDASVAVGFSLSPAAAVASETAENCAPSLKVLSGIASGNPPHNDAWLIVARNGEVTLFSGKVEIGTGTQTAFMQIVAEELNIPLSRISYVQGDTSFTPDQGFTAGSKSIQVQGPLLRRAAATAYEALRSGATGAIASNPTAVIKSPSKYRTVGRSVPRVDLPSKVAGRFVYVSDIVRPARPPRRDVRRDGRVDLPGMLHGRVLRNVGSASRPKNAIFAGFDAASLTATQDIPGFVQFVRKGNFVGVVATTEWAAIKAAQTLKVIWTAGPPLVSDSNPANLQAALTNPVNIYATSTQQIVGDADAAFANAAVKVTQSYYTPYQMHGAMGPSCAVANVLPAPDANGIQATVWSGTQGVYPLQLAIANLLGIAQSAVHVIYAEGAGCYGHNGADDVAADAALMSQLVGRPVRVQWMRRDEHAWEPLGPAMAHVLMGGLDTVGNVVAWSHTLYSPPHNSRPGGGGSLLAGQEAGVLTPPALPTAPVNLGTRNGPVNYNFPALKLTANHVQPFNTTSGVPVTPLVNTLPRSSALRGLGAVSNCFANESFMDELAFAANVDPIEFRKRYVCALSGPANAANSVPTPGLDPRAVAVLDAMAQRADWGSSLAPASAGAVAGRGVAFARYETIETYVAVYAEVEVTTATGVVWVRRVVVAHDCGLIINPDGLRNQIEGNVIQGISRTLIEEVAFSTSAVTSLLWSSTAYPVIHFDQTPAAIEIVLLDHPEQLTQDVGNVPAWGAGEAAIGPTSGAIGNAIFNAIGKRMTVLPITPQRILAA